MTINNADEVSQKPFANQSSIIKARSKNQKAIIVAIIKVYGIKYWKNDNIYNVHVLFIAFPLNYAEKKIIRAVGSYIGDILSKRNSGIA